MSDDIVQFAGNAVAFICGGKFAFLPCFHGQLFRSGLEGFHPDPAGALNIADGPGQDHQGNGRDAHDHADFPPSRRQDIAGILPTGPHDVGDKRECGAE